MHAQEYVTNRSSCRFNIADWVAQFVDWRLAAGLAWKATSMSLVINEYEATGC